MARMADAETWSKRVIAWRAREQTGSDFAAGRDFAASTFRRWASELGRQDGGFVRVVTAPSPCASRDGALELDVDGVRALVRAGFDRAVLADALELLRRGERS